MVFPSPFYRWRPHPWHGLEVGPQPPRLVTAYIELTPFDLVKYEVDKTTGYLKVDRPQHTSSQPPTLYGFIPRTYCGARVGALASKAIKGDGDPLDICVISERPITKSEVILTARVVGGMLMIDNGEADDKILAVLDKDRFWEKAQDVADLPSVLVERLRHYFSTYKLIPGKESAAYIESIYDAAHAMQVIEAARQDYTEMFGE
ncbi:MAG: Inorganic pyrophosphatase [Anaerolineae bacterium]|nr:MAG: Inorganic pyrophosphatase [Anaerolineae bacterium]